jgi:putative ABC transport system substrate-binding protein
MSAQVKRRDFITLLGGAAVAGPLAASAQQGERMRRIGVLMPGDADNPDNQARLAAFLQGLQQFGWAVGRNLRIDLRCEAGDPHRANRVHDSCRSGRPWLCR